MGPPNTHYNRKFTISGLQDSIWLYYSILRYWWFFSKKKVYIKWFWLFTTLQSITVIVKHNRWSIQHVNTRIVTPAIEKRFFGMKPAPLSLLRVPNLRSRPKILAEKLQLMIHERISTHTRNISPQRAG